MLLAFDIGNTNIHLGLWDGAAWCLSWRARTVAAKTADEYAVLLRSFLHTAAVDFGAVSAVCMSSVVPALSPAFQELTRRYLGLEALTVSSATRLGIAIDIDMPQQAGADRLCNAVALSRLYGAPAISVDFGTSTNFDVLAAGDAYIGGAIAPGIGMAHDALVGRAAQLHKVALVPPPQPIGRNTAQAMQSGLMLGYIGLIESLLQRISRQLGAPAATVVATGGMAAAFAQGIPRIDAVAPELTLDGLRLIHELNSGR